MALVLLEEILRAAMLEVAEVILVMRRWRQQQLSRNFGLPSLGRKKRGQSPSSASAAAAPSANCG